MRWFRKVADQGECLRPEQDWGTVLQRLGRGAGLWRCVGSAWPRTTETPAPRTISVGCTLMEKAFRAIWPKRVRRRLVMAMNCQKMACRKLGDRTTGSPAPRPWRPATRRRKHRLRRRGQGSLTARPNARGRAPSRVRVGRDRMNEGPPYLSAASKVAPSAEREPRNACGISFSRWKSRRRINAMSVLTRLKVLVSCIKRAVRTRGTAHLPSCSAANSAYRKQSTTWSLTIPVACIKA